MDTDRNLLFAVLALQANLLDRERFIQACSLWASRKHTPIADLLVAEGWLAPAARKLVDQLLQLHVDGHSGDAAASLAAAAGPEARAALATVLDADVERSLAALPTRPHPLGTRGLSAPLPVGGAGRNVLYEEIGRGGMGRVLRGRDPELGRDLAVKVLREEYQGDAAVRRRFVEEAQVGGQLQHPGVVPVYELGYFPDQRPYFTMKLVKGRTLAELLQERPDPGQDLPRFLGIFEQICHTVAYAHSRGVIHRDLKPSNIMVGSFGEVQVMDWGLAKVLGDRNGHDAEATTAGTLIRTVRSGTTAEADGRTGVVGTPAFMAPEQARGEIATTDQRADVFGLGAILCVILTGQPPYAEQDRTAVLTKAAAADLSAAFARLDASGADAELVALARDCLAARREDRPLNAATVASRMAAYQAAVRERLRSAELERAAAEARTVEARATAAAERRARQRTVGLAATLLLLLTGVGAGAWLWQEQRQARAAELAQRRQAADAAAERAMAEARLLLEQARAVAPADEVRFREARAAAQKAAELAAPADASDQTRQQAADLVTLVETEAQAAGRDLRLLAALLEVRGPREGPRFRRDEQGLVAVMPQPTADEQFRAAFREWGLDLDATAAAEIIARLKARPPAVVAEVIAALDEWAAEEHQRGHPAAQWRRLTELATTLDEPATNRSELRALLARDGLRRERALGALAVALRPVPVPFDAGLGDDRSRLRQLAEQADPEREPVLGVLTLARTLAAAGDDRGAERLLRGALRARPQQVVLHYALGQFLEQQQPPRWAEAMECYAAARALRPGLGDALAYALLQCNRADEGLALYERLAAEQPDNPWLHMRRGNALDNAGRYKEAEAAHRVALRLAPDRAPAHVTLAIALYRQGRFAEAEAACRTAVRLDPGFPVGHDILAYALLAQQRNRDAEVICRQTISRSPGYASVYRTLAISLTRQGHPREAEDACRRGLEIQPDFWEALSELGKALTAQDRHREAEAAFREVLRHQPNSAQAHADLGYALGRQGRYQEAEAAIRKALRLKPEFAEALCGLGAAVCSQGRHEEGEIVCREALRLQPDYAEAVVNLGNTLIGQRRHREAEAALRRAIGLKPDLFDAHNSLTTMLYDQGRYPEAAEEARELVRLKPGLASAHNCLGNVLYKQARFREAEAAYGEAFRLQPNFPEALVNLANARLGLGHAREAEAPAREAIRLRGDDPAAHTTLGNALLGQARPAEAERSFRQALALKPDLAEGHCSLGLALRDQGRFALALDKLRKGDALGRRRPGWRNPSADWVRDCERLVVLDARLASLGRGESDAPSPSECVELVAFCQRFRRPPLLTVRLYAEAFAGEPRLAEDLSVQHRFSAARAAIASVRDAALPDRVLVMLRRQALRWLRADLALYATLPAEAEPATKKAVADRLRGWQRAGDFASVHDPAALDRLPDEERRQWRQFWDDVAALLRKIEEGN
jgi:serine/threonine-protein kinase